MREGDIERGSEEECPVRRTEREREGERERRRRNEEEEEEEEEERERLRGKEERSEVEEEQKKRKEGKSDGGCGQSHRLPYWGPRAGATVFTAGERENWLYCLACVWCALPVGIGPIAHVVLRICRYNRAECSVTAL